MPVIINRSHVFAVWALCALLLFLILFDDGTVSLVGGAPWFDNAKDHAATNSRWQQLPVKNAVEKLHRLPTSPPLEFLRVQHTFGRASSTRRNLLEKRRARVKEQASKAWKALYTHEPDHDMLASVVGCLDTLWIMNLKKEFRATANLVSSIPFDSPPPDNETMISLSQVTSRYVGGLLSAYELSHDSRMLRKAAEVGEMLLVAFDTPNRLPVTHWNPSDALQGLSQEAEEIVNIAEIGALSLEFTRLSQLLGDMRWFDAAQRIVEVFQKSQHRTSLPGLWPRLMNAKKISFDDHKTFSINAMAHSFFEYLPKQFALLRGRDDTYRQMYEDSMAVAVKKLLYRPMVPETENILFAGTYHTEDNTNTLESKIYYSDCSIAATFAFGGKLFNLSDQIAIGVKATEGCIWAYRNSPHKIMPESSSLLTCRSKEDCKWDESRYRSEVARIANKDGTDEFTIPKIVEKERLPRGFVSIQDRRYLQRPAAIEALFVLYRITGDEKYQDIAWEMWEAIQEATQTDAGTNAALVDVTVKDMPEKSDVTEGFWLPETLKYFYLIFSEPDLISLDEWVLNTAAHPLKLS